MFCKGWPGSSKPGQQAGNQQTSTSEDYEMTDQPAPPTRSGHWTVYGAGSHAPTGSNFNNDSHAANRNTHWPIYQDGTHAPSSYQVNNSGHSLNQTTDLPAHNEESHAHSGSNVNINGHSASHDTHWPAVYHEGLHAPSGYHVKNGGHSASQHPAPASHNLTERRKRDPLSIMIEKPENPFNYSVIHQGSCYQPETDGYTGKGKHRAAYVEDCHEPDLIAYTGKGKGRATFAEERRPTPPPKDPVVPVRYSGKGKGRATYVEDCPPTPPPKDTPMQDTFSSPSKGAMTSLISPMRKMGVVSPQAPRLGGTSPTFASVSAAIRNKCPRVFNLLEAIFSQNDITVNITKHMEIRDFLNLYCISKKFYYLVNSHMTTYMMSLARVHAPLAMRVTPYTFRRSLCILDPVLRAHPVDESQRGRVVPGPKWLQMIAFREAVSHDILLAMAIEGHRFPHPIQEILLKMWMLLDLPRTSLRLSLIRNDKVWHNRDLFIALMFLMKLDMRFSDPIDGEGECVLSRLFMAQRSLEPLWEALRGWRMTTQTELLSMIVEWDYEPFDFDNVKGLAVFGVPPGKISSLSCEDWTPGNPMLLRPDELILGECVRRRLALNRCFVDFMLWGYVNWRTGDRIPLPDNEVLKQRFKHRLGYRDVLQEFRIAYEAQQKASAKAREKKKHNKPDGKTPAGPSATQAGPSSSAHQHQ